MLQKVMAWGGSAQVGFRESGNPASRAIGYNFSCWADVVEKRVGRSRANANAYIIVRSGGTLYPVLPGSAQKGAGPSSAWVSGLVAADSCDMFSGLSWAGTRGRESGA